MSKYGVIPGPYFRVFGLKTEIYEVNLDKMGHCINYSTAEDQEIELTFKSINNTREAVFAMRSASEFKPNSKLRYHGTPFIDLWRQRG